MKLTTMTQVTVDGVMQGNGASDEDRRNGFERGGWARGAGDNETRTLITQTYQRADAFLFGRRTYEFFAGSWGAIEVMRAHPIGAALNKTPRYVASTTLTEPRWADTTVLSGDHAAAIRELKVKAGGELQVHGSGTLIRWLLDNDLVDEITLLIVPVVLGQGTGLFPGTGPDMALDLAGSRADSKGVTIQVYRPAGRPQYAAGRFQRVARTRPRREREAPRRLVDHRGLRPPGVALKLATEGPEPAQLAAWKVGSVWGA
jgi:dihydrofolate reductase